MLAEVGDVGCCGYAHELDMARSCAHDVKGPVDPPNAETEEDDGGPPVLDGP